MENRSTSFVPDNIHLAHSEQLKNNETAPIDDCGVCAVWTSNGNAPETTVQLLYELMNRGRASTGMTWISAQGGFNFPILEKDLGPANEVFDVKEYVGVHGNMAHGHDRYTTTAETNKKNAQPLLITRGESFLSFAHNGNINNLEELRSLCQYEPPGDSDSAILTQVLMDDPGKTWKEKFRNVLPKVSGSFSFTALTEDGMYGGSDFRKNRPLWYGESEDCYTKMIVSESAPLEKRGFSFKPVKPGEMIYIDNDGGVENFRYTPVKIDCDLKEGLARCVVEDIYLQDNESRVDFGKQEKIGEIRKRLGRLMAEEDPLFDIDNPNSIVDPTTGRCKKRTIITSIPNGGIPFADGYADAVAKYGAERIEMFDRPPNGNRSYQAKTEEQALQADYKLKIPTTIMELLANQDLNIINIDDSIIRGTVSLKANQKIRQAIADVNSTVKIHSRAGSPMVLHECDLGIVIEKVRLLARKNDLELDNMANAIGADSIRFQSVENLLKGILGDEFSEEKEELLRLGLLANSWRVLGHCVNCMVSDPNHNGNLPLYNFLPEQLILTPTPLLQVA